MNKINKIIIKYTTIGEIASYYAGWIGWFSIMIINFFSNQFQLKFLTEITTPAPDDLIDEIYDDVLKRLIVNDKIIKYSIILFVLIFLSRKYLNIIFRNVLVVHIFGIVYLYSGLYFTNMLKFYNVVPKNYTDPYNYLIFICILQYVFDLILSSILLGITVSALISITIDKIERLAKKISTVKITYTETEPICIEKIV
jgi:hypothetical protein